MIRFVFLFFGSVMVSDAVAQARLDLHNITLKMDDRIFEGRDLQLPLRQNSGRETEVINAGGAIVTASVKLKRMKSRISQHKGAGIRMTMLYTCSYLGEVKKEKHEKIIWPSDEPAFDEAVKFSFGKGLQALMLVASFRGELVVPNQ